MDSKKRQSISVMIGGVHSYFPQQILNNFPTAGKHYHRKSNFWR